MCEPFLMSYLTPLKTPFSNSHDDVGKELHFSFFSFFLFSFVFFFLQGTSIEFVRTNRALLSLVDTNLVHVNQTMTKLCCVHL